jgi:two-component system chemotaxis response regulator CheB
MAHDIVVIGASAGGVEPLLTIARALPDDFDASVFIVLHFPQEGTSVLPELLNRSSSMPAAHASNGEPIRKGRIYVAPPGRHVLVTASRIRLERGPRENRARPSIDPLFRSAAQAFGERVVGVVLSGALDDGTAGLVAIRACGGVAVVQHPDDAAVRGMPESAIEHVKVDHVVPADEIGPLLLQLRDGSTTRSADRATEVIVKEETDIQFNSEETKPPPRTPAGYSCPDCGGTLWELNAERGFRFRCRTGHAFGAETLAEAQSDAVETALWASVRALEEGASLARRLAGTSRHDGAVRRFSNRADVNERHAVLIRQLLARDATTHQ